MRFHYVATEIDGHITEADTDAADPNEVLQILIGKGLRPISIKPVKSKLQIRGNIFGQTISTSDKIFLTRYLSLMLRSGTDLFSAINILVNDFDKPALKALLIEIRGNLEKGNPFYTTFANYPNYFSPVFINLVKSGELSGNLSRVLDNLSTSLTKDQELHSKIVAALVYPVILLVMAFLMMLLLATFALPKIAAVFSGSGFTPPLFSRIVFAVGLTLNAYAAIVFPGIAIGAVGIWYFLARTYSGKRTIAWVAARTPVIRDVVDRMALQRFASTLSSLMKAGLPIVNAIEVTAETVGSDRLREALLHISREGLTKGLTIGEAFRREAVFPLVVSNLIAISEKAGHIDDILLTLATFYESEVDASVKTMVSFIEPILLLMIGLLVGTIALSVIVPIYQLVGGL
ncbi:type II secretion system F family protein [Patescibacteria group bacterium]|nr:type II secretion system F family protein [Patescibacteria group bacterium]